MKIAIEKIIPYIGDALTDSADLLFLDAYEFDSKALKSVDVIVVRTTVRCDAKLLEGTSVRYILTATIGFDHIDTDYCKLKGIIWKNAPGCNADSVVQYFLSALSMLGKLNLNSMSELTVGVIGYGNVGRRIDIACRALGMKVLINDPLQESQFSPVYGKFWSTLEEIAQQCDVITVHTPLTSSGAFATYHLLSHDFFEQCAMRPIIINAARGGIVDEGALIEAHKRGLVGDLVIDCWENEPMVNRDLLHIAAIHTPHIAGYSADGKANAARICLQHLSELGYESIDMSRICLSGLSDLILDLSFGDCRNPLEAALLGSYDIRADSDWLKAFPDRFREYRDSYCYRRESRAYTVCDDASVYISFIRSLGFKVI